MSIQANCPGCRAKVRVPESLLGKRVKCPKCSQIFAAEDPNPGFEQVEEEERTPKRRRPVRLQEPAEEDQFDDDEPQPRRRRGSRRAAEMAVKGPAIALAVVGGIGLLFALLNAAVVIAGKGFLLAPGGQQQAFQQQAQLRPGILVTASVIPVIWGIIVPYGAFKMLRLENFSSVMIAVIFAMLPCNGFCLFALPFAIWALVVLNRPAVKMAFDR
jgi:predicted Zn finger-like uncharacterized protein